MATLATSANLLFFLLFIYRSLVKFEYHQSMSTMLLIPILMINLAASPESLTQADPNQNPGTGQETINPNSPGAVTEDDGFNGWWLLPLLLIPLVLLMPWGESEDRVEQSERDYLAGSRSNLAYRGAKGGKVTRSKSKKRSTKRNLKVDRSLPD